MNMPSAVDSPAPFADENAAIMTSALCQD